MGVTASVNVRVCVHVHRYVVCTSVDCDFAQSEAVRRFKGNSIHTCPLAIASIRRCFIAGLEETRLKLLRLLCVASSGGI